MGKKLLLVDDDAVFIAILKPALERRGLEVSHATLGSMAREMARENPPDLVVMDGLLPDTDGLSCIESLRSDLVASPVVFVSSWWKDRKSHERLRQLGVSLIVQKPVTPAALSEKLSDLLQLPPLLQEGVPAPS